VNSDGNFNAYVYYNNSQITLSEVGIFLSSVESKVNAAKWESVPSGVEHKKDTSNIVYNSTNQGTYTFYNKSKFTSVDFSSGKTYYYKFYSRDTTGEVAYSSIQTIKKTFLSRNIRLLLRLNRAAV